MTRGAVREASVPDQRRVSPGRPPWWLMVVALVVLAGVTADLLAGSSLGSLDQHVSDVVGSWGLRYSDGYWFVWLFTQFGGRAFIVVVLAVLVVYLALRRRTLVPLVRVLIALALLTAVVYGFKYGAGRTAPSFPGSYWHRDGASYPSWRVANAVLMWGVARWQAVCYALPNRAQRAFAVLSVAAPVIAGVAMLVLNFHWVTDVIAGGAVGVLLLGVVHAVDRRVLSRWVRARDGRESA